MAEPDSWEDMDAQSSNPPAPSRLNANAPSFSFNVNAPAFAPVQNPYYNITPPQAAPAAFYPVNSMNRPPFVNPTNPVINTGNPSVGFNPQSFGSDPPYIASSSQSPAFYSSPPAGSHAPAGNIVAEEAPVINTSESEGGNDVNSRQSEELESGELRVDDARMEVDDKFVKAEAKTVSAANGQTNGYEDQVASDLQSLKLKEEVKQEATEEMSIGKGDRDVAHVEDIEEPEELEKKQHMNVVFIGHVDAGKSTIGGQILFLSNMVDERTIQKYEKEAKEKHRESWYMAYIMDTNEEERAKGKTVEVGRAHFETEKTRFTILDAPP